MTLTDNQTSAHSTPSADPRPLFASSVATGRKVVAGVHPDQLGLPTPCDDFDVRALLGHLTFVLHRVTALGNGADPFAIAFDPAGVADDAWVAAWDGAAAEVQEAWADDEVLARTMRLPWAEGPGAGHLAGYINEVVVHTWDLATATDQHPSWDDDVLEVAFEAIRQVLPARDRVAAFEESFKDLPTHLRNRSFPFAEAVEVPSDAPLIERLVAYNGRRA